MAKGTVKIKFTVGFGNNLFQYSFGRLVAELNGMKLNHPAIPEMGIEAQRHFRNPFLPTKIAGRHIGKDTLPNTDYHQWLRKTEKPCNYLIRGYFEDYTLYKPYLEKIRFWFPKIPKTNTRDVVIHIRLQNRILRLAKFPHPSEFIKAVKQFGEYDRVHIVTDSAKWGDHTLEDIKEIAEKVETKKGVRNQLRRIIGKNKIPQSLIKESLENMKIFVDGMQELNPIVHLSDSDLIPGSPAMRQDFIDHFNFIRSFDKILVHNSTFSWWAAVLSEVNRVGVWALWKRGNKNLGETDYPGWFQWGKENEILRG